MPKRAPFVTQKEVERLKREGVALDLVTEEYKRLNIEEVINTRAPCFIMFCAATEQGKSFMMRHLMRVFDETDDIESVVAYCGSVGARKDAAMFVPKAFIVDGLNIDHLQAFLKKQEARVEREGREAGYKAPSFVVIIDDCSSSKSVWRGKSGEVLSSLLMEGRHRNIKRIFITTQYIHSIPKEIRAQLHWLFARPDAMPGTSRILNDDYFGLGSQDHFEKALETCTKGRSFMVLNARKHGSSTDRVFTYEAPPEDGPFRFGERKYYSVSNVMEKGSPTAVGESIPKKVPAVLVTSEPVHESTSWRVHVPKLESRSDLRRDPWRN
jgi:hypothetical protein